MKKIPKCMSTQHPDNVNLPFFAKDADMSGDDEVQEAYYAFSHLGCDEQMWDCEGKEVDNHVIKKLISRYGEFFHENRIGEDLFITLRVPNPSVDKTEAKIMLEILESIPRSYDIAKLFYGEDIAPIFEVILPMTTSFKCLNRIDEFYKTYVVGKQFQKFAGDETTIADWIGEFKPSEINIIPLYEDMDHMLEAHTITEAYLADKQVEHQRVFLARSDPAMNYGLVSAVLLNKIALQRLQIFQNKSGVSIYPIIGVGSAPFRGNLKPQNVDRVSEEYPSAHTFTVQSSFKYDNNPNNVLHAINKLKKRETGEAQEIDEVRSMEIIKKYSDEFQRQIRKLAPVINKMAKFIPSRRKRKLHTGLFGYSRNVGEFSLPRAITFTASLYSIGLPPELLALNALDKSDIQFLRTVYVNFDNDLHDALRYFNPDNIYLPDGIPEAVKDFMGGEVDHRHKEITGYLARNIELEESKKTMEMGEFVLQAANLRKFLG